MKRLQLLLVAVATAAAMMPNLAGGFSISRVVFVPGSVVRPGADLQMVVDITTPTQPAWLNAATQISTNASSVRVDIFPNSGSLTAVGSLRETVTLGQFAVGTYQYEVVIHPAYPAGWGVRTNGGTFSVQEEVPAPQIVLVEPRAGEQFQPGSTIPLRAVVSNDFSGGTWSLEFFSYNQFIGRSTPNQPIWWSGAWGGEHVITARGSDSQGLVVVSDPVRIQVGPGPALPVVKIGATPWRTAEPCPTCLVVPSVIQVERSQPTNAALSVSIEIGGTATPGVDYPALPATIEIPPGQHSAQLTLLPRDDQLVEGPEVVWARIVPSSAYLIHFYSEETLVLIHDDEPNAPRARLDIIAPTDAAQLPGGIVELSALAVNLDNEVYGPVDFYSADQLVARSRITASTRPGVPGLPSIHTAHWTNPPTGLHRLTARTQLSYNNWITSPPVNVTVDASLPTVRLETWPLDNPRAVEFCPPNADCAYPSFVVRRTGETNADLRVSLSYSGTATAEADYPALPTSVVIPAGRDAAFVMLVPKDDTLVEGPETVVAHLASGSGYFADPERSRATITITDNEAPQRTVVSIRAEDPIATEPPEVGIPEATDRAVFRVSRTGDFSRDLAVFFSVGGSATPREDYFIPQPPDASADDSPEPVLPSHVVIRAGQDSAAINVVALNDNIREGMETVLVQLEPSPILAPVPGYEIDSQDDFGVAAIFDLLVEQGPTVQIVAPHEGARFRLPASVEIIVAAFHPAQNVGGLDLYAGFQKIGELRLPTPGPAIRRDFLVHRFRWSQPPRGTHTLTVRALDETGTAFATSAPVNIVIEDDLPGTVVRIDAVSPIAEEDSAPFDRPSLVGMFRISRTGPTNDWLAVWLTYSGTATPGNDYPALPIGVSIPPGTNAAILLVEPLADGIPEGIETVVAEISNCPPWPILAPCQLFAIDPAHSNATVFIRDDGLTRASVSITRPTNGATFQPGRLIHIEAVAIDLDGYISRVEFWDGETRIGVSELTFIVPPDPGTPIHHRFEWSGASRGPHVLTARVPREDGTVLRSPPVNITVAGDPFPTIVRIEATSSIAEESSEPFRRLPLVGVFTISRTGPTNDALPVFVHYSGTATMDVDYPSLPGFVTIPGGATSTQIRVQPIPDNVREGLETVVATISDCPPVCPTCPAIPCYGFGVDPARASATVFVRDDGLTEASLTITNPPEGATFEVGRTILIEAVAIDLDGYISRVEFFDGEQRIGVSEIHFIQPPPPGTPIHHEFAWNGAAAGAHTLTARATRPDGSSVVSPPVHITVGPGGNQPPTIAITQPTNGAVFLPNTPIEIVAQARDPDGHVRTVEFYADGRKIGERSIVFIVPPPPGETQTFNFVWREPTPGPHVLTARAIDDANASTVSNPVGIRVAIESLPIVTVRATDCFAVEPGPNTVLNTATFRLRRFGPTNAPLTVAYSLHGTASNGIDYEMLSGSAVIPAGRFSVEVTVRPLADTIVENIETVLLRLDEQSHYRLGFRRRAAALISDTRATVSSNGTRWTHLPEGLHICFAAGTGNHFRVEATSDLLNWDTVLTATAIDGTLHFIEENMASQPHRFYRLAPEGAEPTD